jgi:hypothetical protein
MLKSKGPINDYNTVYNYVLVNITQKVCSPIKLQAKTWLFLLLTFFLRFNLKQFYIYNTKDWKLSHVLPTYWFIGEIPPVIL